MKSAAVVLEDVARELKDGNWTVPQPEGTIVADAALYGCLEGMDPSALLHVIAVLLRRAAAPDLPAAAEGLLAFLRTTNMDPLHPAVRLLEDAIARGKGVAP